MTVLLVVPPQAKWGVGEQRQYACAACARHFIAAAGIGYVLDAGQRFDCELHYDGVCEAR